MIWFIVFLDILPSFTSLHEHIKQLKSQYEKGFISLFKVGVLNVKFALKLRISKKFNMSQMNPKEVFHNTAYSVQLPNIAGHSL